MISSVDYVVAVGHASGLVSVFQLLSLTTKTNSTVMTVVLLTLLVHV